MGPLLDPERHCVVLVNMFGNGRSSSPTPGAMGLREQGWVLQHTDNVRAQRRLLEERFGVERVALILGWSMGAQQAYQWAVQEPDRVERIFCVGGTARTGPHNRLFLQSLRQALTTDRHWNGAGFSAEPLDGLRLFATIYASWAASQASIAREGIGRRATGGWRTTWSRPGCPSTAATIPAISSPCSIAGWTTTSPAGVMVETWLPPWRRCAPGPM